MDSFVSGAVLSPERITSQTLAGPIPRHPLQIQTLGAFKRGFVPPEDVVDGLMRRGWFYAWTAPTGMAKTAIAVLLALCVASGRDFAGRNVLQGRVLYCAGENPDDVRGRFIMTGERLQFDSAAVDTNVSIIDVRFDMATRLTEMRAILNDATNPFVLLIVDTDAAYAAADDENDNAERVRHAMNLRSLNRTASRPTVIDLCHPTKQANRDNLLPRGGGSFVAEVDGNFGLWRDGDSVEMFSSGKHRGPPFAPMQFKLQDGTSEYLRDSRRRFLRVPYAEYLDDAAAARHDNGEIENRIAVLRMVKSTPRKVSLAELALQLGWFFTDGTTPDKSRVQRTVQALTNGGALVRDKVTQRLSITTSGSKLLGEHR